jgi:hypothetical protein
MGNPGFNFIAVLPAQRDPLKLVVPYTAKVDYPNQLSAFSLVHAFQFYLSIPPHKEDFNLGCAPCTQSNCLFIQLAALLPRAR